MWNPLSWVMEADAIMANSLANGGGKPPDWQDFLGIITVLIINSTISFTEENKAVMQQLLSCLDLPQKQRFYEMGNGMRKMLLC